MGANTHLYVELKSCDPRDPSSSRLRRTPMSNHAASSARERPVRVHGGCRLRDDGVARPVRLRLERLRQRGAAGRSKRSCTATCSSSCDSRPPTAARSSSARRSRSSRGCGAADSSPCTAWSPLPCLLAAAVLGVWLVARMRSEGHSTRSPGGGAGSVRGQPAHAARARTRPSRGAARRLSVRRRGAARRPRSARCGPGWSLRAGDRQQGVGAARGRAGPAGTPRETQAARAWRSAGAVAAAVLAPLALVSSGGVRRRHARGRRGARRRSSSRGRCGGSSGITARSCNGADGAPKPGYRTGPKPGRCRPATC